MKYDVHIFFRQFLFKNNQTMWWSKLIVCHICKFFAVVQESFDYPVTRTYFISLELIVSMFQVPNLKKSICKKENCKIFFVCMITVFLIRDSVERRKSGELTSFEDNCINWRTPAPQLRSQLTISNFGSHYYKTPLQVSSHHVVT